MDESPTTPREIATAIVADARERMIRLAPEYDSVDLGERWIADLVAAQVREAQTAILREILSAAEGTASPGAAAAAVFNRAHAMAYRLGLEAGGERDG